ncbi:helix-turn-helix domain-containing protein [Fusibacter ferrireducens]|uniref:Helix-turn-helix transcriptional regulator n=1 Tax=Fusibacter ferrireducens TaxID=2785058 RepID=A0ABR9ZNX5_9FIRM|nr:helix-turn-helix transcriptional regulator [Fusibacter ferrireducens]MBF4692180.1 helix-turn-helix transcriptional regulator [Fusibacter ferrireducens]
MDNCYKIESIAQLHELIGAEKPKHPLITLVDLTEINPTVSTNDLHIFTDFYTISLKEGNTCKNKYGRQYYDFQEGSLTFVAPRQELYIDEDNSEVKGNTGWILCFHSDLIDKSVLSKKMNQYTFFSYASTEALHLSDQEKAKITSLANDVQDEFCRNMDVYSTDLIISYIELLLNHCKRFYGRQFITRAKVNKEVIVKFDALLKHCFESDNLEKVGLPTVKFLAQEMGYSPNYLSDLLKKETGKNTQEHIYMYLMDKAKRLLMETDKPVQQIAAELGFEYPQHFSKLFKTKTGMSPMAFRN